ncbi:MAG TPA: signal peptidase I [Thermoanaerobaculia bacterium]|nr:signal peptidase I [Thermoanaerobaculia bacterium]
MAQQKSAFRLIVEPLAIALALAAGVRAACSIYSIPSASMMPSLQVGDHIVVTPYRLSAPDRGDVIVFHAPENQSEFVVKRIIGMPGDVIDTRAGRVRIGDHTLAEPYLFKQAASGSIQPLVIPHDSFFVMGDNREDSVDSRRWGTLRRDLVVGRVRLVLWSSGEAGGDRAAVATTRSRERGAAGSFRLSRIFKWIG